MSNAFIPPWDEKQPLTPDQTDDGKECVSLPGGCVIGNVDAIMKLAASTKSRNEFLAECEKCGFNFQPNGDI